FPIPDNWRICGELMAPPQQTTSPAVTLCKLFPFKYSTPTARFPEKRILVVSAPQITSRFFRFPKTGCRYASEADQRLPFLILRSNFPKPSCWYPFTSSVGG